MHPIPLLLAWFLIAGPVLTSRASSQAVSEETVQFFAQNCTSCHTIGGGRLAGPDLKGVSQRQERPWLVTFLMDPKGTIDRGDPYGQKLLQEARGVYMQAVPGMTRDRAEKLLDLIDHESSLEKSQFSGLQVSDRPLTDLDVLRGERLFRGSLAFESGAPSCISCHTTAGLGGLGGGRLGPDLTASYARLEGRNALAAWLSAPPSLVMQPVYRTKPLTGEEVLALVAYLKATAEKGEAVAPPATLKFLLLGAGGAAVVLVLFDFLWRNRFSSVRKTLVEGSPS